MKPYKEEDMQNNNSERDNSDFSSIWNTDDDLIEDSEEGADQLWFDTWEGQIELSANPKIEDDFEVDEFDEWRVYSPLERLRGSKGSLLRSASLPQQNRLSNNAQNNRFHSAHTLFWDLHYDEDVRA